MEQQDLAAFARPDLLEEARRHFNEPMLSMFDVVRCVGYGEDDCDCYILVRRPYPHADIIWLSCVGGYTFLDRLRGQGYVRSSGGEDWDDMTRLDSALGLNGAPREPEFLLRVENGGHAAGTGTTDHADAGDGP